MRTLLAAFVVMLAAGDLPAQDSKAPDNKAPEKKAPAKKTPPEKNAPDAKAQNAPSVVGLWKIEAAQVDTLEWPLDETGEQQIEFTAEGGFKFVKGGGGIMKGRSGAYKAGQEKKLATIDITMSEGFHKGKPFLGIYELKGDQLVICLGSPPLTTDAPAKRPPKMFAKADLGMTRLVLKKVK